jgi:hypothetical protein
VKEHASIISTWIVVVHFITAVPIKKLFAWGGRGIVKDMCYEIRRAEACVDLSAHHALVNAGKFVPRISWLSRDFF